MNILILHAHDMGRYNSIYGYAPPTPNMERLASQGQVFRNAHSAAPTCSPSRAAMLTGRNIDNCRSKRYLMEYGLADRPTEVEALYDLVTDSQECHNLVDMAAYSKILEEMRSRLDTWLDKTDDPIRHGPVPLPPGAKANTRESIHPEVGPF